MPPGAAAQSLTERQRTLCAAAWVWAVGLVYLFLFDNWLIPFQLTHLAAGLHTVLPAGPALPDFLYDTTVAAALMAATAAAAFSLGALVVTRLTREQSGVVRLAAFAVGAWLLAVGVLLTGLFSTALTPVLLVSSGLLFHPSVQRLWHRGERSLLRQDWWTRAMLALALVAVLLQLPGALAPPFEYDELEYHLGALAEYRQAGRIIALPHNFYSNLPQLAEMLYLPSLAGGAETGAKLVHWLFGALTVAAVYVFAARLWSARVAGTAAAMFACLPFVQDLAQTARIDLVTTFEATLAFGFLLLWHKAELEWRSRPVPGPSWHSAYFWLSAIAAGTAVATKWTAVAVVWVPATIVAGLTTRSWRRALGYALPAAVLVAPWLLKNAWFAGNPVYPLFDWLFPSPHWSAAQAALFARKHYAGFGPHGLWELLERPWHYSFAEPGAVPLLLATLPLLALARARDRAVRLGAILFGLAAAGWYLGTFRPWRFLLPVVPLGAMVGGWALLEPWTHRWCARLARAGVAVLLLAGIGMMGMVSLVDVVDYRQVPPRLSMVHYLCGQVSRDEFVATAGREVYEPIIWMNEHLPPTAVVLYVGEARVALARHRVVWATAFDQHPLAAMMRSATTPTDLAAAMRERGITHIYVNQQEWQRLARGYDYLAGFNQPLWDEFLASHASLVHHQRVSDVYALHPSEPGATAREEIGNSKPEIQRKSE